MITSVAEFRKYFEGVRGRTHNYVKTIPPDEINWSPGPQRFSCGDLVRHLAATEQMYVTVVLENKWQYHGHEPTEHTWTLDGIIAELNVLHDNAMEKLLTLPDNQLNEPRFGPVPDTRPLKAWRWLMLMVEHEIHHRSELASYLTQMGYQPPQIYGLSFEDLQSLASD